MALREVNLIPAEVIFKRQVIRHLSLWFGSLVIVLGSIFGLYQFQIHTALSENRSPTTLADLHVRLGTTLAEIKLAQQEIEKLSQQDAFLQTLSTHQSFSEVLLKLATLINAQSWLSRLVVSNRPQESPSATGIQLYGYALSNEDVGNFLTRLSETDLFQNVVLRYARETRISQPPKLGVLKVIQFQIDCETPRRKEPENK